MVRDATNKPGWHRLVRSLRSGKFGERERAEIENLALTSDVLQAAFQNAYLAGGNAASRIYSGVRSFRPTDPRVLLLAQNVAGQRIKEIADSTKASLRTHIREALAAGTSPADLANTLKPHLGLTLNQTRLVRSMREGLLAQGLPRNRANRRAANYAQTLLRQRAETIAETEMQWAIEEGKRQYWDDLVNAGLLSPNTTLIWVIEDDEKVDDLCLSLAGTEVQISGPGFTTTVGQIQHPPIHPRCRCQLILSDGRGRVPVLTAPPSPLGDISSRSRLFDLVGDDGFSLRVPEGQRPVDGYMVALAGYEEKRPLNTVTRAWVDSYRTRHGDLLRNPENFWGGWVEKDVNGQLWAYLDVSRRFATTQRNQALRAAQDAAQKAIYNIKTGKEILVPAQRIDLRRIQGQTRNRFTNMITGGRMAVGQVGDVYEQALLESAGHLRLAEYYGGNVAPVARAGAGRGTPVDFEIHRPGEASMAMEFKTLNSQTPNMKSAIKKPEWVRKWAYAIDTDEAREIAANMVDSDKSSVEAAYQAIRALEQEQGLQKTPLLVANVIDDANVLTDESGASYIVGRLMGFEGGFPSRSVSSFDEIGEYRIYLSEWESAWDKVVKKAVDSWGVPIEVGDWVIEWDGDELVIAPQSEMVLIPLRDTMTSDDIIENMQSVVEELVNL